MKIHSGQTSQLKMIQKPSEELRSVWEATHKRSHMLFVTSKGHVLHPVTSQQQPQNKTIFKNRSHHVVMCCIQLQASNSPKTKRSLRTGHTMCMLDESLYAESGWSYFYLLFLVPWHICLDATLCCEEAQLLHRQDMLSVLAISEDNDKYQEDHSSTNVLDIMLILYRKI